jgi:hypothetical protein
MLSQFLSGLRKRAPLNRHSTSSYRRRGLTSRPQLERLEDRIAPAITIKIDYTYDNGFFTQHADRQTLLQNAAYILASRMNDNLSAIAPSGSDTWTASFPNPSTGDAVQLNNLTIGANTILVFAGARPLSGTELGHADSGFFWSGSQAWGDTVTGRGQAGAVSNPATDFGPWGGAVTFDPNFGGWYFGQSGVGIAANQVDFLSVAEHELGHLLGFGTADSWDNRVSGTVFTGPAAVQEFGGNVPVDGTGAAATHWADGTLDKGHPTDMDPSIAAGQRVGFTNLDFAGLQDLGWKVTKSINVRPGTTPQSATVNTAFAKRLVVQILDFNNQPVGNWPVTFTAPASGPSGTFTGGVTKFTVVTGPQGIATAPTFTANGTVGSYNVVVSAKGLAITKNFALTNKASSAALSSSSTAVQASLPELSQPSALPAIAVGRTYAIRAPMSEAAASTSFAQTAGDSGLSAPGGHNAIPPKQSARTSLHRSGPVDAALSGSENEMAGWW